MCKKANLESIEQFAFEGDTGAEEIAACADFLEILKQEMRTEEETEVCLARQLFYLAIAQMRIADDTFLLHVHGLVLIVKQPAFALGDFVEIRSREGIGDAVHHGIRPNFFNDTNVLENCLFRLKRRCRNQHVNLRRDFVLLEQVNCVVNSIDIEVFFQVVENLLVE